MGDVMGPSPDDDEIVPCDRVSRWVPPRHPQTQRHAVGLVLGPSPHGRSRTADLRNHKFKPHQGLSALASARLDMLRSQIRTDLWPKSERESSRVLPALGPHGSSLSPGMRAYRARRLSIKSSTAGLPPAAGHFYGKLRRGRQPQ